MKSLLQVRLVLVISCCFLIACLAGCGGGGGTGNITENVSEQELQDLEKLMAEEAALTTND